MSPSGICGGILPYAHNVCTLLCDCNHLPGDMFMLSMQLEWVVLHTKLFAVWVKIFDGVSFRLLKQPMQVNGNKFPTNGKKLLANGNGYRGNL